MDRAKYFGRRAGRTGTLSINETCPSDLVDNLMSSVLEKETCPSWGGLRPDLESTKDSLRFRASTRDSL